MRTPKRKVLGDLILNFWYKFPEQPPQGRAIMDGMLFRKTAHANYLFDFARGCPELTENESQKEGRVGGLGRYAALTERSGVKARAAQMQKVAGSNPAWPTTPLFDGFLGAGT